MSRLFSLISPRQVILHIILLCSPRPVGGVWLRDYLLCFADNSNMYMANNSSILQFCHGMSIEGVLFFRTVYECVGGRVKVQVLVVTPLPLFFLEVGHNKGRACITAGQYGMALRYGSAELHHGPLGMLLSRTMVALYTGAIFHRLATVAKALAIASC